MLSLPTQFRCCDCNRNFKTDEGLSAHLLHSTAHRHKKANKSRLQNPVQSLVIKCSMCKKTFLGVGALGQHQRSIRHQPLCLIKCLASGKCKKQFQCPSAQLHHLESGTCPSKITKSQLNAGIAKHDVNGIITAQALRKRLVEENMSESTMSPARSPLLTPTSTEFLDSYPSTPVHTPRRVFLSSTSVDEKLSQVYNMQLDIVAGRKQCPFCPSSRTRTFDPGALQQHLSSGIHAKVSLTLAQKQNDEMSFHCPRALMKGSSTKKPLKHFSTVSGLAQHIESGACHGGKETLHRAVEYIQNEMKSMSLGGLKLLK